MRFDNPYDARAMGYAQRRIGAFCLPWYGMMLAIVGLSALAVGTWIGSRMDIGVILTGFGLALALIGWVVTLPRRTTRKLPKPVRLNTNPITTRRTAAIMALSTGGGGTVIGIVLLVALAGTPGASPIWILPFCLIAFGWTMAPILMVVGATVERRNELFGRWLAEHPEAESALARELSR